MNQQLSFLDPPISRRNDPDTSKAAEARQNLGPRARRPKQILSLVRRHPRRTSGEYARIFVRENPGEPIKVAAETPHKRISDLDKKGLVETCGKRECTDSGYVCYIWQATAAGIAEDVS